MKNLLLFLAFSFCITSLWASDTDSTLLQAPEPEGQYPDNSYTSRSTLFGIGGVNRLETYLSPLEYTGTEFRFLRESMRLTRMAKGRISCQQFFEGNFSVTKSPTDDAQYLSGDFGWHIGWHYNWTFFHDRLRLLFGGLTGANIGVVYNTRNGNNPAQGKLNAELAASGAAIYKFYLLKRHFTLRYQLDIPVLGAMFSPAYGQSYYEIFNQNNSDHNVCITWTGNAPTFSQLLTLDVPIGPGTMRIGYRSEVRQSHVNSLKSHQWSNLFMIGYVRHFRLIKNRKEQLSHTIY